MYGLYQIVYFTIIDILNTLKSPFFIGILGIIYFQYYKIGKEEKKMGARHISPLIRLVISTLYGIIGGIIATVLFIYLGVVVVPRDFMYILIVAIILSLINPRFMCYAYGGSLLSLINLTLGYPNIDVKQIMSVVAVLHIIESILIFLDGSRYFSPIKLELEGDIIGGFNMNRFWPIPFVVFIGEGLIYPITLMAILNYGDYTISTYPKRKTKKTAIILFIYSLGLLFLTKKGNTLIYLPIFALLGHEFIIWINKFIEGRKTSIFNNPLKGVRVLHVSNNSIAKDLNIEIGDILLRINNISIKDLKDMEDLILVRNKDIRIEYFNKKKGLVSKEYKGNNKPLGLMILPRDYY